MLESLELLRQGGWPMIPLALCSLVALAVILERSFVLRRRRIIEDRIVRALEEYQGEASAERMIALCRRSRAPFARIVEEVVQTRRLEHAQAIEVMHAVGRTQVGRLERGLTMVEIIAGISPLIGLLGTVLGMVTVFNAITVEGLGNPQVLADGISKALITTVAGLCVAIPALAFHGIFSKRVEELATEMQNHATGFIVKLQGMQASRSTQSTSRPTAQTQPVEVQRSRNTTQTSSHPLQAPSLQEAEQLLEDLDRQPRE